MIAKVKLDDKEYFSYIFLIGICDYKTKVVVFDDKENKFEFLDAYKNKYTSERVVEMFDYKEDGLIKNKSLKLLSFEMKDCLGFDWLINNIDLINDIEQGKQIDEKYVSIAREMNSKIDVYKWHEVTNEEEANELMDISGTFHDAYIRDFKGVFGRPYEPEFETKLQVAFEMKGNHFDIMMEFEGEIRINYEFYTCLNYVYLSSVLFHEGRIYWAEGSDEIKPVDIKDFSYVSARKLRWKIIDKLKRMAR